MKSVWIVIPAFNEATSISSVVASLKQNYANVVVVDDGSGDDTAKLAQASGATVISHVLNQGQGASLRTGTRVALTLGADVIVHFDADGQFEPQDIKSMLTALQDEDVDIVLGSRFLGSTEGLPLMRKIVLKFGILFTYCFSGILLTDAHNGFRAMKRFAAESIRIRQSRMAHSSEIIDEIARHQLRYREIPVRIRYTEYSLRKGQSTWNAIRIAFDFLLGKYLK